MKPPPSSLLPRSVWFPDWADVLTRTNLPVATRQEYRSAIFAYLHFCKTRRKRATVASAREFMREREAGRRLGAAGLNMWKSALNWFFQQAGRRMQAPELAGRSPSAHNSAAAPGAPDGPVITGGPTLGAADLGRTEWEKRLIQELRSRNYSWRTEQTYRGWAWRFVRWLDGRSTRLEQAAEIEVREFLTHLATRQRASASAQKQALNALVFLLREALARTLEDFGDYTRARKSTRVPVVLSRQECRRLFEALEGVPRLMAELMYGSGVRLTELLGLRVHPVR